MAGCTRGSSRKADRELKCASMASSSFNGASQMVNAALAGFGLAYRAGGPGRSPISPRVVSSGCSRTGALRLRATTSTTPAAGSPHRRLPCCGSICSFPRLRGKVGMGGGTPRPLPPPRLLNEVQYRNGKILITKAGKPVAALVDIALFERIRKLDEEFDQMTAQFAKAFAGKAEKEVDALVDEAVKAVRANPPGREGRPRYQCTVVRFDVSGWCAAAPCRCLA